MHSWGPWWGRCERSFGVGTEWPAERAHLLQLAPPGHYSHVGQEKPSGRQRSAAARWRQCPDALPPATPAELRAVCTLLKPRGLGPPPHLAVHPCQLILTAVFGQSLAGCHVFVIFQLASCLAAGAGTRCPPRFPPGVPVLNHVPLPPASITCRAVGAPAMRCGSAWNTVPAGRSPTSCTRVVQAWTRTCERQEGTARWLVEPTPQQAWAHRKQSRCSPANLLDVGLKLHFFCFQDRLHLRASTGGASIPACHGQGGDMQALTDGGPRLVEWALGVALADRTC